MVFANKLALARRFRNTLREEGAAIALGKARTYLGMRLRRVAPSALGLHGRGIARRDDQYLHGIWQSLARQDAFHICESPAVQRKRRQIAMIADLNLPQCRKYRVEQLAQFWRARGVEFEYAHYLDVPRASQIMQQATHLMEYRLQATPVTEMLRYEARRLRLPILYDLDDPLFSVSAYETYGNMDALDANLKAQFLAEAPKYLSMMNGADAISVSTPGMAAHAGQYTARPIFLRRNFADEETLLAGKQAMRKIPGDTGDFIVAFASGSQGHEVDLAEILEPLCAFIAGDTSRKLLVLGHFDVSHLPASIHAQVKAVKFASYPKYLAQLAQADCAVIPLCDDIFNRCKSAVRVLDASSVGVPSIVSAVGDLSEVVQHEKTGLVARSPNDWGDALEAFHRRQGDAARMGRAARQELEARWSGQAAPHVISPELLSWVEA